MHFFFEHLRWLPIQGAPSKERSCCDSLPNCFPTTWYYSLRFLNRKNLNSFRVSRHYIFQTVLLRNQRCAKGESLQVAQVANLMSLSLGIQKHSFVKSLIYHRCSNPV